MKRTLEILLSFSLVASLIFSANWQVLHLFSHFNHEHSFGLHQSEQTFSEDHYHGEHDDHIELKDSTHEKIYEFSDCSICDQISIFSLGLFSSKVDSDYIPNVHKLAILKRFITFGIFNQFSARAPPIL